MKIETTRDFESGGLLVLASQRIGRHKAASMGRLREGASRGEMALLLASLRMEVRGFIARATTKRATKKWRGKRFNLGWQAVADMDTGR